MNKTFINPYSFVPFSYKINEEGHKKTKQDQYLSESDKYVSGWLDIDIHIKTPLIIPDGAHPTYYKLIQDGDSKRKILSNETFTPRDTREKNNAHVCYSFQKLPNSEGVLDYAIPGSELRGAVRSAYESVTDSCFPFLLKDRQRISQRVPVFGALHRRGLLCFEGGKWKLYSAKTVGTDEVKIQRSERMVPKPGRTIKEDVFTLLKVSGGTLTEKTGSFSKANNGVVQYNIPVDISKTYHVAYLQKNELIKEWSNNEPYENMCSVLDRDSVIGNNNHPNQGPNRDLKAALDKEREGKNHGYGVPVYYFYVIPDGSDGDGNDKLVYLSNSAIGRIAQRRKWNDIIGDYKPCDGKGELCPACLLFGTKEGEGLKGRVRFTDAFSDDELEIEKHCLGILGGPRPSAFEYYLNRPFDKATYWNFDFYGVKTTRGDKVVTEYKHLEKATPRGRKFYWHSQAQNEATPSNLNSTMNSISKGTFHSKVFFDGITNEQLNDLMWVITMGDNSKDSSLQYKLGHAKPLGYGSCKLTISGLHRRVMTKDQNGEISFAVSNEVPEISNLSYGTENQTVKAFLRIADANSTLGQNVEYPNGAIKTYEWFANNRTNADTLEVLPDPLSDCIYQENITEQKNNGTGKARSKHDFKAQNVKTVCITGVKPDRKDPSMNVAFYNGGMIFNVPKGIRPGDSVQIKETKDGPKGKMANYIST